MDSTAHLNICIYIYKIRYVELFKPEATLTNILEHKQIISYKFCCISINIF